MHGRIFKRFRRSWQIVLSLDPDPKTGKRRQKWIAVKGNRESAQRVLRDLMHQYDTTGVIETTKLTVREYLEKWLMDYKPKLTPLAAERYQAIIQTHLIPSIGQIPLTKLRPEHLQSHYSRLFSTGLKSPTVHYDHTVIHVALVSAVKWGLVGRNVADFVDVPPNTRAEIEFWDSDEMNQFIESIKANPYYVVFYIALFTGMRRGEILGLQWSDIDILGAQLSVRRELQQLRDRSYIFKDVKSKYSRRTIALTPSTITILKEHSRKQKQPNNDLVFSNKAGNPLRPLTVSNAWSKACSKSGVKVISFHGSRHTHATILLKQGVHPKIVQERLGHSSIQVTLDTYSHIVAGLQEAAAKAFDQVINIPIILDSTLKRRL